MTPCGFSNSNQLNGKFSRHSIILESATLKASMRVPNNLMGPRPIASLYPDLSLSAQYGLRNTTTKYLFNWASRFYSVGPSISLPIFQGGSLTANVHLAKAEQAAAAIAYRKAVLNALQEVENALVSFHQDQLRAQSLKNAADANSRALALATSAYRHGLASFITVLDSERQAVQTQTQLTSALVQQSTDLITLYKALGGGWELNPPIIAADDE